MRTGSTDTDISWGTPSPPATGANTPMFNSPVEERDAQFGHSSGDGPPIKNEETEDEDDGCSFHTASDGDSDGPFTPVRTGPNHRIALKQPTMPGTASATSTTTSPVEVDGNGYDTVMKGPEQVGEEKRSPTKGMLGRNGIKG